MAAASVPAAFAAAQNAEYTAHHCVRRVARRAGERDRTQRQRPQQERQRRHRRPAACRPVGGRRSRCCRSRCASLPRAPGRRACLCTSVSVMAWSGRPASGVPCRMRSQPPSVSSTRSDSSTVSSGNALIGNALIGKRLDRRRGGEEGLDRERFDRERLDRERLDRRRLEREGLDRERRPAGSSEQCLRVADRSRDVRRRDRARPDGRGRRARRERHFDVERRGLEGAEIALRRDGPSARTGQASLVDRQCGAEEPVRADDLALGQIDVEADGPGRGDRLRRAAVVGERAECHRPRRRRGERCGADDAVRGVADEVHADQLRPVRAVGSGLRRRPRARSAPNR